MPFQSAFAQLFAQDTTIASVVFCLFWLPEQRFKINAYPGRVNSFTITFPHAGRWTGRCAQLCGLYHYGMDFIVQAPARRLHRRPPDGDPMTAAPKIVPYPVPADEGERDGMPSGCWPQPAAQ